MMAFQGTGIVTCLQHVEVLPLLVRIVTTRWRSRLAHSLEHVQTGEADFIHGLEDPGGDFRQ